MYTHRKKTIDHNLISWISGNDSMTTSAKGDRRYLVFYSSFNMMFLISIIHSETNSANNFASVLAQFFLQET